MGLKNLIGFKLGKTKEKADSTAAAKEALASKIAVLEEHVNGKTRELAEAEQQIKNLAVPAQGTEEETVPRPHGPLVELVVEPSAGEEPADENAEVGTIGGVAGDIKPAGIKTAEVKPGEAKAPEAKTTAPAPPAAAPAAEAKKGDDSLSNLFSQDEDEENPLAALINSLPDVSARELLDDLQEIKTIIREAPHR